MISPLTPYILESQPTKHYYRNQLKIYGLLTQRIMENHDIIFTVQPYDVSSIDVKFPVCDHQLEIKGEEQVQVLKSSTIKCL